jgi:hypothetical protein
MAEARAVCSASEDAGSFKLVVLEPVQSSRAQPQTGGFNGTLCVVSEHAEVQTYWFWRDRTSSDFVSLGVNLSGQIVDALRASPGGTYLAVQQLSEALTEVEVVDLPALIRQRVYRTVGFVTGFPGYAAIVEWTDDSHLVLSGDTLLSRPSSASSGELALFEGTDRRFSWDVVNGKLAPFAGQLETPVVYYCARTSDPFAQTRLMAIDGLAVLGDRSAIPCLERALTQETDRTLRAQISEALQKIRKS